jgi:hypothetical protein
MAILAAGFQLASVANVGKARQAQTLKSVGLSAVRWRADIHRQVAFISRNKREWDRQFPGS